MVRDIMTRRKATDVCPRSRLTRTKNPRLLPALEPKFEDKPKRFRSVLPVDLLAFGIAPSVIADVEFVNAKIPPVNLRAHLYLDAEVICGQPQRSSDAG
jgi:hypothetical protein